MDVASEAPYNIFQDKSTLGVLSFWVTPMTTPTQIINKNDLNWTQIGQFMAA